jgi:uncharacterized protein (TIGR03084 family)
VQEICDDLTAETDALRSVMQDLAEDAWQLPTPAAGWDSRDTIAHLGSGDWAARLATNDPDAFNELKSELVAGRINLLEACGADRASMTGAELWGWFDNERADMITAFRSQGPKDRIPWVGPDMSALSFATARLMETWSHGHDLADTHHAPWPPTDRLRNVAHLGVTTRGWAYTNRGLPAPAGPVRVELVAPSGQQWEWGPADADNIVRGTAEQFCQLVTQRRHRTEVKLQARGQFADEWLNIAQAYAGPATDSRQPMS